MTTCLRLIKNNLWRGWELNPWPFIQKATRCFSRPRSSDTVEQTRSSCKTHKYSLRSTANWLPLHAVHAFIFNNFLMAYYSTDCVPTTVACWIHPKVLIFYELGGHAPATTSWALYCSVPETKPPFPSAKKKWWCWCQIVVVQSPRRKVYIYMSQILGHASGGNKWLVQKELELRLKPQHRNGGRRDVVCKETSPEEGRANCLWWKATFRFWTGDCFSEGISFGEQNHSGWNGDIDRVFYLLRVDLV